MVGGQHGPGGRRMEACYAAGRNRIGPWKIMRPDLLAVVEQGKTSIEARMLFQHLRGKARSGLKPGARVLPRWKDTREIRSSRRAPLQSGSWVVVTALRLCICETRLEWSIACWASEGSVRSHGKIPSR